MREILFRGKRIDTGEWVYGYFYTQVHFPKLTAERKYYYIKPVGGDSFSWSTFQIAPATVGQYTGLRDKNGTRIFEGDIIATPWNAGEVRRVVHFENGLFKAGAISLCSFTGFDSPKHNCEVIGNIHDIPELMEGE